MPPAAVDDMASGGFGVPPLWCGRVKGRKAIYIARAKRKYKPLTGSAHLTIFFLGSLDNLTASFILLVRKMFLGLTGSQKG